MPLIKCKECGKEVSNTAISCPSCGFGIKKHEEQKISGKGCLVLIAICLIFGFIVSQCNEDNKSKPGSKHIAAYIHSQTDIKNLLKSPASAEFPYYSESFVNYNPTTQTYTVNAYVDSQNSFGAMLRTNYSGTFSEDTEGNIYTIEVHLIE